MKTCFKCGEEKPVDEFYRHPQMGDGHLGKCKECTKADVRRHRAANLDKIRAYDRERASLPHRAVLRARISKADRKKHPQRARIRLQSSRKFTNPPETCSVCGEQPETRIERHHYDYDDPSHFVWVCKPCHYKLDEARRAQETPHAQGPVRPRETRVDAEA
jgi:hypothetical protein